MTVMARINTPVPIMESHRSGTCAGYLSERYARALAAFGHPRALTRSGGWLLERSIPGTPLTDALGCYPRFFCHSWDRLGEDLHELAQRMVTVALVTDPFTPMAPDHLQKLFPDACFPFKTHLVIDLERGLDRAVSRHHRYQARRARQSITVERCAQPLDFLDEWNALYDVLIRRHRLSGIKAFSRESFQEQLGVSGIIAFRATHQGQAIGGHLWYPQGEIVYSHLAASNEMGYRLGAAYALHWEALQYFVSNYRWVDLGSVAGVSGEARDGLWRFKQGWANDTRQAYFCGRIFDRDAYRALAGDRVTGQSAYFPAYRAGELG